MCSNHCLQLSSDFHTYSDRPPIVLTLSPLLDLMYITHKYTNAQACTHACIINIMYTHTHLHTRAHMHVRTYTQTQIHTYAQQHHYTTPTQTQLTTQVWTSLIFLHHTATNLLTGTPRGLVGHSLQQSMAEAVTHSTVQYCKHWFVGHPCRMRPSASWGWLP